MDRIVGCKIPNENCKIKIHHHLIVSIKRNLLPTSQLQLGSAGVEHVFYLMRGAGLL